MAKLPHEPINMHTFESRSTRSTRSYADCTDCTWRRYYEPGTSREQLQAEHDRAARHYVR